MLYVSVALPRDFIFAPASLFYILKFMYYDLVSELTTGNRPYCKRGFFFLPSWLPAVDLDHLSTRAPPPGTVPCSVQGISQTTIPERGSGQHAAWTGRLPVQSCLAQLATTFCCKVRVIDPTWSLPSVSTVITTFMILMLQIVGSLQARRAWPTSRCSCPWSWRSLLPVQVSLVPSSLFST